VLTKLKAWFVALSTAGKVGVIAAASVVGVAAASAGTQPPACTAQVTYSTETQSVAYDNTNVDDNTLTKGDTKVTTTGVNGEQRVKHQVTKYTPNGCKPNTDTVISTTITKKPVNQVTAVGTYVAPAPVQATPAQTAPSTPTDCPNGTYTNSEGNTVCSPYSSPSAPAGATAQCVDGTYSFSQSRSGTCSHHGGVSTWL